MKTLTYSNQETGASILELAEPVLDTPAIRSFGDNPSADVAQEINRLCAQATNLSMVSSDALHSALVAVWHAGRLLLEEKKRVRVRMGPGSWMLWLERHFQGTPRTAQRYMLLAKNVPDVSHLPSMGLRQAYLRLGIAMESKGSAGPHPVPPLPRYLSLAGRLLGELNRTVRKSKLTPDMKAHLERDLRPLYERMRSLVGG